MRKANPKMAGKYFPKRSGERIDTAGGGDALRKNSDVLRDAYNAWSALESFRRKIERNKMYVFGDQWGDRVKSGCSWITERQSIIDQGNTPITNNRIRGIVRSVAGVFQSMRTEPVCVARDRAEQDRGEVMSSALQYVYHLNRMWGLDSSNFQYFLVAGVAAFRSTFGWRDGKMDVWTDLVNPNHLFFDSHMNDPRHRDCHLIGEIYDVGLYDLMAQFAEGSREKAERIRQIYGRCDSEQTVGLVGETLTEDVREHLNFFLPEDPSRCRVIEVWRKESRERLLVHDRLTGEFYRAETGDE
jgi:hypothetical protein